MPKGLGACCWSMGWTGRPFGDGITARVASATNTLHPGSRYWEAQTAEAARASEQLGTATLPCVAPRCQEARSGCVVGGQGRPTADGRGARHPWARQPMAMPGTPSRVPRGAASVAPGVLVRGLMSCLDDA